jgi:DNA replication protein DnaC
MNVDNLGFFLLSGRNSETLYRDIIILFVLVPLLKYLLKDYKIITDYINNYIFIIYKYNIEFIGFENLSSGNYFYDYPLPMTAICHYASVKNICKNLRYFNHKRNSTVYCEDIQKYSNEKSLSYIINYSNNIKISDDLYIDYKFSEIEMSKESKLDGNWKVTITLKSRNKNIDEINRFVNQCINEYNQYLELKNKDKLYHFIYQKKDEYNLQFTQSILSDYSSPDNINYQTFNNIYSDNKEMLLKDLARLKDTEYYKRTGNKRKKGYLFYGPPGCGKTSSVIAMALESRRHIIEISMSRITTNEELEKLFNQTEILDVKFKNDEIILLFDEIDNASNILKKREGEDEEKETNENKKDDIIYQLVKNNSDSDTSDFLKKPDKINLGSILSRFDGVGAYNGLIIIGTTNCIDKLSPALYRDGRLNKVYFDYINRDQIKNMIEEYYNIKLTIEQISKLPCRSEKMSHSTIRKYIEDYEDNYKKLLAYFETLSIH